MKYIKSKLITNNFKSLSIYYIKSVKTKFVDCFIFFVFYDMIKEIIDLQYKTNSTKGKIIKLWKNMN